MVLALFSGVHGQHECQLVSPHQLVAGEFSEVRPALHWVILRVGTSEDELDREVE